MSWKLFKTSIPISRLTIYLAVLALLPLVFVVYDYAKKKRAWEEVSEQIFAVHHLSEVKARKQYLNTIVREKYQETDQFYLDHQLESLTFLKKERGALEHLMQGPTFTGNEAAEKRYEFLTGVANRIQFNAGNAQSGEGFTETIHSLAHPIEIDTQDLKELLSRLEGNRPGKPQLIVTDFKLNKKSQPTGNEVYELNLKLLKREFLK